MAQAQKGDTVSVHYTGRLTDDTTFDSSRGRNPLKFQLGSGEVIAGFDEGIVGMEPGETKTVKIEAADAYGLYDSNQVVEVQREAFPDDIEPVLGQQLQVQLADGQPIAVIVSEVLEDSVMLDANHPLAGQDLIFDIELVSID